jgi:soluble lytic murein transglycosylase
MNKRRKTDKSMVVIWCLIVLLVVAIVFLAINGGHDAYMKKLFPKDYHEIVERYAEEYAVDSYLIYAVIKTESGFNPKAVSNVGARGLMQIMPDTFEWIRDYRLREENIKFDSMFNPEDNIRYGVYLLSYLQSKFEDWSCIIAAYHAGDSAVDEWLEDERYFNGTNLHDIPIPETAHYVNKVKKAWHEYIDLYLESQPCPCCHE